MIIDLKSGARTRTTNLVTLLTALIAISFTGSFSAVAAVFCVRRPFSRSADAPVGSSASRPALQQQRHAPQAIDDPVWSGGAATTPAIQGIVVVVLARAATAPKPFLIPDPELMRSALVVSVRCASRSTLVLGSVLNYISFDFF